MSLSGTFVPWKLSIVKSTDNSVFRISSCMQERGAFHPKISTAGDIMFNLVLEAFIRSAKSRPYPLRERARSSGP